MKYWERDVEGTHKEGISVIQVLSIIRHYLWRTMINILADQHSFKEMLKLADYTGILVK